jgi:hypothetical protein
MNPIKAAFAKRYEAMSAEDRAAKAARLRELLGQVRGAEHALRNTQERFKATSWSRQNDGE